RRRANNVTARTALIIPNPCNAVAACWSQLTRFAAARRDSQLQCGPERLRRPALFACFACVSHPLTPFGGRRIKHVRDERRPAAARDAATSDAANRRPCSVCEGFLVRKPECAALDGADWTAADHQYPGQCRCFAGRGDGLRS